MKDQNGDDLQINFLHGTTTLGFVYKGGVILAVDSRATGGKNTDYEYNLATQLKTSSTGNGSGFSLLPNEAYHIELVYIIFTRCFCTVMWAIIDEFLTLRYLAYFPHAP